MKEQHRKTDFRLTKKNKSKIFFQKFSWNYYFKERKRLSKFKKKTQAKDQPLFPVFFL